ncbi:unnamed protein product [Prorocentrum cordatum]|uniref:Uncharacterized protein n=1 Tax=Prorocentrum cordatum TaxID=2364126 RepID=A0ABN9SXY7_9DINO|nr:unnamed protein product [Polarella glacialis]
MFLLMPLFLLRVEVGAPGAAGGRLSGGCSRSSSGDSPRAGSGRKGVLRAGGGGPEIWESAGPSRGNGRAGQRAGRRAARGDGRLAATGDPPQGQQAAETRVGNLDPEALQKAPGHAGSSRGPAALGGGRSDHGQRVPRRRGGEGRGEEEGWDKLVALAPTWPPDAAEGCARPGRRSSCRIWNRQPALAPSRTLMVTGWPSRPECPNGPTPAAARSHWWHIWSRADSHTQATGPAGGPRVAKPEGSHEQATSGTF